MALSEIKYALITGASKGINKLWVFSINGQAKRRSETEALKEDFA